MQKAALKQIEALVASGEKRGLVVSATGTGKTYLGAFAVKKYQPRRFLYIVQRLQIINNIMVAIISERGTQPVINTGTQG